MDVTEEDLRSIFCAVDGLKEAFCNRALVTRLMPWQMACYHTLLPKAVCRTATEFGSEILTAFQSPAA